jgi:hypothetical protein
MMIRGRHRGLPYEVDRAVMLPGERLVEDIAEDREQKAASRGRFDSRLMSKIKRYHTR